MAGAAQSAFAFEDLPALIVVPTAALQCWHLAPGCAFDQPTLAGRVHAVGWEGPHHCFWCFVETECACAAFDAAVARGEFDAEWYTPADRRAHAKTKGRR